MRAKGVIFHNTSPVGIDHLFSIFLRSDAVFPVIFIRKTSSRPAKHRNPDCSQGLCNIVPDAVGIGNGRILPHINSVVNAAAQMFGKMSVNFRMNPAFSVIGVYNIFCHEIASPLFLICFLPFGLPSFIVSFFAFSLSLSLPYPGLLSLLFVFVPPVILSVSTQGQKGRDRAPAAPAGYRDGYVQTRCPSSGPNP